LRAALYYSTLEELLSSAAIRTGLVPMRAFRVDVGRTSSTSSLPCPTLPVARDRLGQDQ
jgi:hypothetical protein